MSDLTSFLDVLANDEFDEKPVKIEEFVRSKEFLGLPELSPDQWSLVKAATQIYKHETIVDLWGLEYARIRWRETFFEVIMQLGKGSGKDFCSSIAVAYMVYLLLCLKDPADYYGRPPGEAIDILNIAINAQQAKNVFFKYMRQRITNCRWFDGKYSITADAIAFDKGVTVYSGHSEREAWEGYNTLVVILDEIAGFAIESTTGNENAKTAEAVYKMYSQSVVSRYSKFGKVLLLSWPRFKGDFITQRYDKVVAEKTTTIMTEVVKIDPDLPDGVEQNEVVIEWEHDIITKYNTPRVFALKRTSWEMRPDTTVVDYAEAFISDPVDSLGRFACMPPEAIDAFFKSRSKIEAAFKELNIAVSPDGVIEDWFKPQPGKRYYIHVDLAQKHDRCAVTMAHVDHWRNQRIMDTKNILAPFVVIDAVRYWTPTSDKSVDFTEVKDYILNLKRMGFDIRLVTFDRWNSHDLMQQLKGYGMNSETLSVAKKHYDDFALAIYEDRLVGPHIDILINELLRLRINKDKVDHPRQGSKDLADATCGAIFNAVSLTPKDEIREIPVKDLRTITKVDNLDENEYDEPKRKADAPMPEALERAIAGITII